MQKNIEVKIGSLADFKQLATVDFTNTYKKVFSLSRTEFGIKLSEEELEQPVTNESDGYQTEINEVMIPMLGREETIPLVACVDNELAGYLMAFNSYCPQGKVMVLFGILVSNQYKGYGVGKALVEELKSVCSKDGDHRGIKAEMGTDKHAASKLLLKNGFVFSGAELYVYSNNEPSKFSKECIHFYYKFSYTAHTPT
jgi:GNAT superfamily N-acetyltransferase